MNEPSQLRSEEGEVCVGHVVGVQVRTPNKSQWERGVASPMMTLQSLLRRAYFDMIERSERGQVGLRDATLDEIPPTADTAHAL